MRSQRLTYRPIDARDAGRIAVFAGDWDVARMTSRIPHPYSLIDADLWIASIGDDEFVRGVERDGELIGAVGYISNEPERGRDRLLDRQTVVGQRIRHRGGGNADALLLC